VQTYFKAQLDQYLVWLDRRGLSKNALTDAREEVLDHEGFLELETANPLWLPVSAVTGGRGVRLKESRDSGSGAPPETMRDNDA
jgi:hypothetical protein